MFPDSIVSVIEHVIRDFCVLENFLTAKAVDIRITIEIYKFRE